MKTSPAEYLCLTGSQCEYAVGAGLILAEMPELSLVSFLSDPHCGLDQSKPERLHLSGAVG